MLRLSFLVDLCKYLLSNDQHKARTSILCLGVSSNSCFVSTQRNFWTKFSNYTYQRNGITRWIRQFEKTGCLCVKKISGCPHTPEDANYAHSPRRCVRTCVYWTLKLNNMANYWMQFSLPFNSSTVNELTLLFMQKMFFHHPVLIVYETFVPSPCQYALNK